MEKNRTENLQRQFSDFSNLMTIFEPKTYNYRQQKAEKLREKPNFAENWNTETR